MLYLPTLRQFSSDDDHRTCDIMFSRHKQCDAILCLCRSSSSYHINVPRGGSPIDNTTDSPIEEDDDRVLIGVLDLRPTPGPDSSILVLKRIMHGKFANDNELETVQQARVTTPNVGPFAGGRRIQD